MHKAKQFSTKVKLMKTKLKSSVRAACRSLGGAVCVGAVMLIASSAQAQNLFVADSPGTIYEFTPGGARSIFASGLNYPQGLAFNSASNLFVADLSGNIYEFTPGGARSTFASGLNGPRGLAFNSAGNLFEADFWSDTIYEFTPGGVRSVFASVSAPYGLAFDSAGNLFVADWNSGSITDITPDGAQTTFATWLSPCGLAFDSAGNLFDADDSWGNDDYWGRIFEFTPGGGQSNFAGGLNGPSFLAFQGVILPVPEPSALGLLALGAIALLVHRRHTETVSPDSSPKVTPDEQ